MNFGYYDINCEFDALIIYNPYWPQHLARPVYLQNTILRGLYSQIYLNYSKNIDKHLYL